VHNSYDYVLQMRDIKLSRPLLNLSTVGAPRTDKGSRISYIYDQKTVQIFTCQAC